MFGIDVFVLTRDKRIRCKDNEKNEKSNGVMAIYGSVYVRACVRAYVCVCVKARQRSVISASDLKIKALYSYQLGKPTRRQKKGNQQDHTAPYQGGERPQDESQGFDVLPCPPALQKSKSLPCCL